MMILAINSLVDKSVDLSYGEEELDPEDSSVHSYVCNTLSIGFLLMEFNDAVCKEDGNRIFVAGSTFFFTSKELKEQIR